ncbi:alpha-actinin, sarcomeric-like [Saccoglossus kowalevskii]|uniref:Alpha-actinin, sarcomeric-like n=1 Tax=Saccoglossus kowalevskii TaxID=10224 RepID=A0ABM0GMJ6_SACKO|nr:PREDICTED: alpha-actinin, sarcomeric-like [Saccoglossus kowalevskii]
MRDAVTPSSRKTRNLNRLGVTPSCADANNLSVKMAKSSETAGKFNDIGYLWNMHKRCHHINYDSVRQCLTSLGYHIGEDNPQGDKEFNKILLKLDPHRNGYISYDILVNFLSREPSDEDPDEQLLESFRLLARGKAYITPEQLRNTFPPDIADYCIGRMALFEGPAIEGALDYTSYDIRIKHPDYR